VSYDKTVRLSHVRHANALRKEASRIASDARSDAQDAIQHALSIGYAIGESEYVRVVRESLHFALDKVDEYERALLDERRINEATEDL
jgi:flagellar biosynthesis/type III secretory pathway protein FliH